MGGTDGPDPDQLGTELWVQIGRIARKVRQYHASGELTLSEASVLARLDREGPASPGVLAELEGVRPQAMATTVTALVERGLVTRTPDPGDGRRVVMTITHRGRGLLRDRRSAKAQRISVAIATEFSLAEQRRLAAVLGLLDRLADRL